jgi:small subunit ribosomal protein S11e
MAELQVQNEKSFQKQAIFQNSKGVTKRTRERRWYKDVGLGFKVRHCST